MSTSRSLRRSSGIALVCLAAAGSNPSPASAEPISVTPDTMPRIATISDRYLSYNVEMAEVIGGSFWKPYDEQSESTRRADLAPATSSSSSGAAGLQAGQDPSMFEVRPPIDLTNPRLRKLAAALEPAYRPGEWHVGEHRLLP